MRVVENPAKLLALTSSYKLMLSNSVTMQRCPLNVNESTIRMTKCFSFGSYQTMRVDQDKSYEIRRQGQTNPFDKVFEHFDLDESLMVETFLVPDNLDSDHISSFVIPTLQYLTE